MPSNRYEDPVFKEKRRPKGEIKFVISLNEEQKEAKSIILQNTITVIKGQAGCGKSLLSAQTALDLLYKKEVEKIIITRPTVEAAPGIGFLPGDITSKLSPYTAPVFENMYRMEKKDKIESLVSEGLIEVLPLNFIRGRNFTNCIVVVDESQNITHAQMHLLLGRICNGSKMILCGDNAQIDLKLKTDSGFDFICKHMASIEGFAIVTLKTNHRHPIVEDILKIYKDYESIPISTLSPTRLSFIFICDT